MTTPEEREKAREAATDALNRAEATKSRGERLAEAWRRSRLDNNFRLMLRELARGE